MGLETRRPDRSSVVDGFPASIDEGEDPLAIHFAFTGNLDILFKDKDISFVSVRYPKREIRREGGKWEGREGGFKNGVGKMAWEENEKTR